MVKFTNILVPTDFSDNSVQALEFAHCIAMPSKAILHVLHIIESSIPAGTIKNHFNKENFERFKLLDAEKELRRFINKISPQGIKVIEALEHGKPCEQILSYSTKNHIDLIVIASHGWTGLYNIITGNVANKVICNTQVPIVCIKSGSLILQKSNSVYKSSSAENWFG